MKCWECRKETKDSYRVCYLEYHEAWNYSKEKYRDVCYDCYRRLLFDSCHFVRVKKITGRQLNLKFYKVKIMNWGVK